MSSPTPAPPIQWLTQVHSLDCFCYNTPTHNHPLYLQRDDVSPHTIYLIQGDVLAIPTHNHSLHLQRDDVSLHTIYLIQGDVFATPTHNHSLHLQRDDVSLHTIYLIQGDVFATAKKIALCPDADAERHDPTNVAVGASVRV